MTAKTPKDKMITMQNKKDPLKPFVIGITGNIGTGKSLVRKMLRHLGALSLDADELAHAAYQKGSEGYRAIRENFGDQVLSTTGGISRCKLGELVFNDVDLLHRLETIIHPIVIALLADIFNHPPLPVIAVEAVKLLESDIRSMCDRIWVVGASNELVSRRLKLTRGMKLEEIDARRRQQSSFINKANCADVVLMNNDCASKLWKMVLSEWQKYTEGSEIFFNALQQSAETLSPFEKYLLKPSEINASEIALDFQKSAGGYIKSDNSDRWADLIKASGENGSEQLFLFLCSGMTWRIRQRDDKKLLMTCDFQQFNTNILGYMEFSQWERNKYKTLLGLIEDYSRLQLSSRILLPFKGETNLLKEMGYDIMRGEELLSGFLPKAEYNLYRKVLKSVSHVVS